MAVFVVDASVALAWCFAGEATTWTEGLLERLRQGDRIIVPAHWPTEVANALLMGVRRRRIKSGQPQLLGKNSRGCPSRRNQLSPPLRPKRFLRLAKGTASPCMTQLTWSSPAATNCCWERSMPTCARQHRQKAYRCCKAIRNTWITWLALLVSSS
jgi:hypothetical protein